MIGPYDEFEWDKENESHLAEHQVDRYEAEDAATDPGLQLRRQGNDRFGNRRYVGVGRTQEGRFLFVVIDDKGPGRWRIGMAREAIFAEKKAYRARNR